MSKPQPIQPQVTNALPPEFMPFANQLSQYLSGRLNQPATNPFQSTLLGQFFGSPGAQPGPGMVGQQGQQMGGGGGFFGQGQNFLQGLLSGQLPQSILDSAQRNLQLGQQGLNSQLQQRGAFFGTPGLDLQRQLSENTTRDLNNMIFGNAMQAIPQGLNLFGTGAGLAGIPNQLNPAVGAGTNFLGAVRGNVSQPQYQPDPFTDILTSVLPFLWPPARVARPGSSGLFP